MPKRYLLNEHDIRHLLFGGSLVVDDVEFAMEDIGLTYVQSMAAVIQGELEDHPLCIRADYSKPLNTEWKD